MGSVELFAAHALAGLCANPHHQTGEHPNTGSDAVASRALALGKALAAKIEAEGEPEQKKSRR